MDISLNPGKIHREDVHFVRLQVLLHAVCFTIIDNILHILIVVQIGHIPTVQDIVYVLQHLLVDDLGIDEQK